MNEYTAHRDTYGPIAVCSDFNPRRLTVRNVYLLVLQGGISVEDLARLPKSKAMTQVPPPISAPLCLKKQVLHSQQEWMNTLRLQRMIEICTPSSFFAFTVSSRTFGIVVGMSK